MSLFGTPLYKDGIELSRRHWAELKPALARCTTEEQRRQCYAAYGFKHQAEFDALGQRHGQPPMLWPARQEA